MMATSQDFENMSSDLVRRKLLLSIILPLVFIAVLWLVRFIESQFNISFYFLGIYPLELKGVAGIFFSPLVHSDASHLLSNTLPLFFLGTAVFYFYPEVSAQVVGIIWITSGILVWIFGRPAWHIGASGIVYGLASFLFISGIIRRYFRLMALSLLVVFLYGSMVWGMFPYVYANVSWEAHMLGAVTGIFLAVIYRNRGPQRPEQIWDDEEDETDDRLTEEYETSINEPDS